MTNDFPIMLHKYLTNFLPNERGYSENTIKNLQIYICAVSRIFINYRYKT